MHPTLNDLPEKTRKKVIALLNARLADATDLAGQSKQAHWSVRGPVFIALHELVDKVYEEAEEFKDLIAERIAQLGGVAEGTVRLAAKNSSLAEYPTKLVDGAAHCKQLAKALAAFAKGTRRAIDESQEAGDAATADLFTEVTRDADKMLWFVEAHLHAKR